MNPRRGPLPLVIAVLAVIGPAFEMPIQMPRTCLAQTTGAAAPAGQPKVQHSPLHKNEHEAIPTEFARRWRGALFYGTLIFLVFVVACIALIRFSRRYRSYLLSKGEPPTAIEDVWSMHEPRPDQYLDDEDEPPSPPDGLSPPGPPAGSG